MHREFDPTDQPFQPRTHLGLYLLTGIVGGLLVADLWPLLANWLKSLDVQNRKLWDDIRKFGIHLYEAPVGAPYNPALHERVGSTRVDGLPALMIAETKEKGYASQQPEFILRRPKVIVTE